MRVLRAAMILVVLITWLGCGDDNKLFDPAIQYEATADFEFAYPVSTQTQLVLTAIYGSIEIVGISGLDSVCIRGTRGGYSFVDSSEASKRLDSLTVTAVSYGRSFTVRTNQPYDLSQRYFIVNYQIRLPREMALDVSQISSTIQIDSMDNMVTIANMFGDVALSNCKGDISASVVSGEIRASCEVVGGGSIDLRTVNGSIALNIPNNTSASLQARAADGIIKLTNLVLNEKEIGTISLTGVLGSGDGSISLSTNKGDIRVTGR